MHPSCLLPDFRWLRPVLSAGNLTGTWSGTCVQYGAKNSEGDAYCVPYKYGAVRYNYTVTYALNGSVGYSTSEFSRNQVSQGGRGAGWMKRQWAGDA